MGFLLCTGCQRHVRASEEVCPFCGGGDMQPLAKARPRVARSALIGAAAVALACGTTAPSGDGGTDGGSQDSSIDSLQGAYGGPPPDASTFDGPVAAYGGPPIDAGTD